MALKLEMWVDLPSCHRPIKEVPPQRSRCLLKRLRRLQRRLRARWVGSDGNEKLPAMSCQNTTSNELVLGYSGAAGGHQGGVAGNSCNTYHPYGVVRDLVCMAALSALQVALACRIY